MTQTSLNIRQIKILLL